MQIDVMHLYTNTYHSTAVSVIANMLCIPYLTNVQVRVDVLHLWMEDFPQQTSAYHQRLQSETHPLGIVSLVLAGGRQDLFGQRRGQVRNRSTTLRGREKKE